MTMRRRLGSATRCCCFYGHFCPSPVSHFIRAHLIAGAYLQQQQLVYRGGDPSEDSGPSWNALASVHSCCSSSKTTTLPARLVPAASLRPVLRRLTITTTATTTACPYRRLLLCGEKTLTATSRLLFCSSLIPDSRWLQLEVCREAQRSKCTRNDEECKFAHPPPHVEIQNGRVTACYDAIKGRCSRENPPCKYYHPPQHLKDQLLVNGRNHLAMKNILVQQMQMQAVTLQPQIQLQPQLSLMNSYYNQAAAASAFSSNPYLNTAQMYATGSPSPGPSGSGMSSHGLGESGSSSPMTSFGSAGMFQQQHHHHGGGGGGGGGSGGAGGGNKSRMDRLEVCREFARRNCRRSETDCRYAHPAEHVQVTDNMVVVCMDSLKGKCGRETCRYFHPPAHLVQQLKSRQSVNASAASGDSSSMIGANGTSASVNAAGTAGNASNGSSAAAAAAMSSLLAAQAANVAAAQQAASSDYGTLMAQAASSPFLAAAALLQQKQTIAMLMAAAQQQQPPAVAASPSMFMQPSGVHQHQNAAASLAAAAGLVPSLGGGMGGWPFSVSNLSAIAAAGASTGSLKRKASFDQDAEMVFHGLAPSVKRQTMSPSALSGHSFAFLQQQQQQQQQQHHHQQQQQAQLQAMYGLAPLLSSFQHSLSMHPQFMSSLQMGAAGSGGGSGAGGSQHPGFSSLNYLRHSPVVITEAPPDGPGGQRDSETDDGHHHPSTSS
ncbi:putative Protein muscleblind [Hypsibius exemplaris]|uniref:C3H1-type domain-containing protein n=1 Tax=Hypsibius exemplaris TaxID=2072580 RepID=A0A1W0X2A4_HYPEX|nr:putative Protein muscleblind [Hypsibius exemplaris]